MKTSEYKALFLILGISVLVGCGDTQAGDEIALRIAGDTRILTEGLEIAADCTSAQLFVQDNRAVRDQIASGVRGLARSDGPKVSESALSALTSSLNNLLIAARDAQELCVSDPTSLKSLEAEAKAHSLTLSRL